MIPSDRLPPGPHRVCTVVDVESYSSRTPTQQLRIQAQIRDIVDHACTRAGVPGSVRQDRGDGQLVILPAGTDLPRVLPALIHAVADRLAALNWSARGADRVRMRGALAGGAVRVGEVGFVGPAVVEAARLVDSAALRAELASRPDRDFAVGVTDALYQDVLRHDHSGLAGDRFRRVSVAVKEHAGVAWVTVPPPRAAGAPDRLRPRSGRRAVNAQDVIAATVAGGAFLLGGRHRHRTSEGPADPDQGDGRVPSDPGGVGPSQAVEPVFTPTDDPDGTLTFPDDPPDEVPTVDDSDWHFAVPLDPPWYDRPHDDGGTIHPHRG